ncbi:hypothetical protein [Streptomyces prunicolor]|uniref:hypothetical protein n=1 Tax=Streptomyces prunicolor TaxID=67348 RepID=UPI00036CD6C8|nr:hypothetical protein [Streptomyces prunicolor]
MKQKTGEPELDMADATGQIESLLGMIDRLMAGTFTAAVGLVAEDQAQMVESLYARVGHLSAGIIRARAQVQ